MDLEMLNTVCALYEKMAEDGLERTRGDPAPDPNITNPLNTFHRTCFLARRSLPHPVYLIRAGAFGRFRVAFLFCVSSPLTNAISSPTMGKTCSKRDIPARRIGCAP